jgi:hypothetical protein
MAVHGLLQIPDYARALIRAVQPDLSETQLQRRLSLRMARQELLGRDNPPALLLVLEECALRRPVGGIAVLRAQLEHLKEATASMPSLTLQVLPLALGEHAAIEGAFALYKFSEPADPDVVYIERVANDMYLESPEQVGRYEDIFQRLQAMALSPPKSAQLLGSLLDSL